MAMRNRPKPIQTPAADDGTAMPTPTLLQTLSVSHDSPISVNALADKAAGALVWCRQNPVRRNYILLAFVAVAVRFYRLSSPDGVVFDEFHFGRFVNNYVDGEYFFDIHPPLGKLTLAAVGWMTYVGLASR
jgi:hypothetical protein